MRYVEPEPADYDRLHNVHHKMLLRCLGWRKRKGEDRTLSYANVFFKEASESSEATVHRPRIW